MAVLETSVWVGSGGPWDSLTLLTVALDPASTLHKVAYIIHLQLSLSPELFEDGLGEPCNVSHKHFLGVPWEPRETAPNVGHPCLPDRM